MRDPQSSPLFQYQSVHDDWMVGVPPAIRKPPYDVRQCKTWRNKFFLLIRGCGFSDQVKEKGLLYFRKPDVNHEEGPEVADSLGVHGEGLGPDGGRICLLLFGRALSAQCRLRDHRKHQDSEPY